ncbi:hypothetical protein L7F22_001655 [Adiantum nelumboides]|nr:hypothetical protein [Adiantum nelumboides]
MDTQGWDPATISHPIRTKLRAFYRKVREKAPSADEVQMVAGAVNALLGGLPVVGAAIQAATYLIQCAALAQGNSSKKAAVSRQAELVHAKLRELQEMAGPIRACLFSQTEALEVLAASCEIHEATRFRLFDYVVALLCAGCFSTKFDQQASQLSNLLKEISIELEKVIADRIAHIANIPPLIPDSASLIQRRDEVMGLLSQQEMSGLVRVVGIHGLPGLGKTTIMHAVEGKIRELKTHDAIAFVEVGEEPLKPLQQLQSDLTFALSGERHVYPSISHGKSGLVRCLKSLRQGNKKVCIFLDNVCQKSHLGQLLPGKLGAILPPSSYLVVSSRLMSVVNELGSLCSLKSSENELHVFDDYSPETLNRQEARDLFVNQAATRGLDLLPAHEELVDEIVPLCCGLPLLLEVYSSYFSSRRSKRVEQDDWQRVADKLRSAEGLPNEEKVFESLKTTIDRLMPEALKEAFVDIALFYSQALDQQEMLSVRHYLDEEYYFEDLREQSLISVKEDYWREKIIVSVHDLLRTIAANLNKGMKMVYIRVDKNMEVASQDLDKVRAAIIKRHDWTALIAKMSQLRYLEVSGLRSLESLCGVESSCCELRALKVKFDTVDEELPLQNEAEQSLQPWVTGLKKIRFLELVNCHWESFAKGQLPENLHVLLISYNHMPLATQLPPFCANIETMTKLRRLEFHNCLCEIPAWIENLKSLTRLSGNCTLSIVSEAIGQLGRLRRLDLSNHHDLQGLPNEIEKMSSLAVLDLRFCTGLTVLPDCLPPNLKEIKMTGCSSLTKLPASLGSLTSLKVLSLLGCVALAELPDDFSMAKALKEVYLSECSRLAELPASLVSLASLEKLEILNCEALAKLPDDFSTVKAMKQVDLSGCSSLAELPPSLVSLASLERLSLWWCGSLAKLPDNFSTAKALKEVYISECSSLVELPASLVGLVSLEVLWQSCLTTSQQPKL